MLFCFAGEGNTPDMRALNRVLCSDASFFAMLLSAATVLEADIHEFWTNVRAKPGKLYKQVALDVFRVCLLYLGQHGCHRHLPRRSCGRPPPIMISQSRCHPDHQTHSFRHTSRHHTSRNGHGQTIQTQRAQSDHLNRAFSTSTLADSVSS